MPSLVQALTEKGITTPFPVQQMAIPVALTGTDLIGQARTGTGKTLAFGLPLLQRILSPDEPDYADLSAPAKPQALVVCPTRELALQVTEDLRVKGNSATLKVALPLAGGNHTVRIGAREGATGPVSYSIKLKKPKGYPFAMEDVPTWSGE